MKELTHLDADKFWDYFDKEYPEINRQFPKVSFLPAQQAIVAFKPARMSQDDYDKYNEVRENWLTENGFR
jgi:hypothetical protein